MNTPNDLFHIAEDDKLRSSFIYELLHNCDADANFAQDQIPRLIVQFWDNPDEMPEDVRECIESWMPLEKLGFKRLLYDTTTAAQFILSEFGPEYLRAFNRCMHPAMKCDYFRLCYLYKNGGFYIDADEKYQRVDCGYLFEDDLLKLQPLCYDNVNDTMVEPNVFIDQKIFSDNWTYYVNNNPIIAPPNHRLILLALDRATQILLNSSEIRTDIQSTTGPGNLSASLVRYSIERKRNDENINIVFLNDWNKISITPWPLSYRNDERNWRLWDISSLKNRLY